jgi:hypothetical protein
MRGSSNCRGVIRVNVRMYVYVYARGSSACTHWGVAICSGPRVGLWLRRRRAPRMQILCRVTPPLHHSVYVYVHLYIHMYMLCICTPVRQVQAHSLSLYVFIYVYMYTVSCTYSCVRVCVNSPCILVKVQYRALLI